VVGNRKKVTESRRRCKKGVLCGILGSLGREGIFTQTVARKSGYRHRDGKTFLQVLRRRCPVNFVNMYSLKKEDMDGIITII
jgi:hypothetical protein